MSEKHPFPELDARQTRIQTSRPRFLLIVLVFLAAGTYWANVLPTTSWSASDPADVDLKPWTWEKVRRCMMSLAVYQLMSVLDYTLSRPEMAELL